MGAPILVFSYICRLSKLLQELITLFLMQDLPAVISRICDFLGKHLGPEGEARLAKHVSFANMKANDAVSFEKNYEQVRIVRLSFFLLHRRQSKNFRA
jgi:hypothetical protein